MPKLIIFKIYVSNVPFFHFFDSVLLLFTVMKRIHAPVGLDTGRESLELHYILSERSSFVREYIVHHTELFVEVRTLRLTAHVFIRIICHVVPLNKCALEKFDAFKTN